MLGVFLALMAGLVVGVVAAYLVANRRYTALRIQAESTATTLRHKSIDLEARNEHIAGLQAENRNLSAACASQASEIEMLRQQSAAEAQLRQEQFQEQLKVVREQFQNLATTVLAKTSDQLRTQNREAMELVTKPIGDSFAELQKAIIESDRETAKTAASPPNEWSKL